MDEELALGCIGEWFSSLLYVPDDDETTDGEKANNGIAVESNPAIQPDQIRLQTK